MVPGERARARSRAWLASELAADVIHTDEFASWDNPVDWWPELLDRALKPLARGAAAQYQPTAWAGEQRAPVIIEPAGTVLLEGVTAYLAYSIWVDTHRAVRMQRGIDRDGEGARRQWERWMEAEDRYIESERPAEHADIVVPGDKDLWR